MKPLNFTRPSPFSSRSRMSRRAWYVVFGAERLQPGQKIQAAEMADRIHTLYDDIEAVEVMGAMEAYASYRAQQIIGESDVT